MDGLDCEGYWASERYLGETGITVLTCTGCGDLLAIHGGRNAGFYPKGTTDREIIEKVLEEDLAIHMPMEIEVEQVVSDLTDEEVDVIVRHIKEPKEHP